MRAAHAQATSAFAEEVGADGPVTVVGGRTHWSVGGLPPAGTREVRAPAGVVELRPDELTVRCGAGTCVAELSEELAAAGQEVPLDPPHPDRATVGGVLAVGWSGLRRRRVGPVRDTLLEARYVSAEGEVVVAGGPTVKNVSGFDLCRLLVGSLGTLGLFAEVLLRARPHPASARWFTTVADPFALARRLYRPSSLLWDGQRTWVLLEGHPVDVADQAAGTGLHPADRPPPLPPHRWSLEPGRLRDELAAWEPGSFVAEVGVGTVHADLPPPGRSVDPAVARLHATVKDLFDPTHRLNPGRDPMSR